MKLTLNDPKTLARLFTPKQIRKLERQRALHIIVRKHPKMASHPKDNPPTTEPERG